MTAGLLDTSVLIASETGRPIDVAALPDELSISVITIAELRVGVLAATDVDTRDRRLGTLTRALDLDPLPIDKRVGEAWARLRIDLRDAGLRLPVNDSWIAATAIAHGLSMVTQDGDYEVAALEVIRV